MNEESGGGKKLIRKPEASQWTEAPFGKGFESLGSRSANVWLTWRWQASSARTALRRSIILASSFSFQYSIAISGAGVFSHLGNFPAKEARVGDQEKIIKRGGKIKGLKDSIGLASANCRATNNLDINPVLFYGPTTTQQQHVSLPHLILDRV